MIRIAQLDLDDPYCEKAIINLISLAFRSEKGSFKNFNLMGGVSDTF